MKRVNRSELPSIIDEQNEGYQQCLRAFCQVYDYLLEENFEQSHILVALGDLSINANLHNGGSQLAQMFLEAQHSIVEEWADEYEARNELEQ